MCTKKDENDHRCSNTFEEPLLGETTCSGGVCCLAVLLVWVVFLKQIAPQVCVSSWRFSQQAFCLRYHAAPKLTAAAGHSAFLQRTQVQAKCLRLSKCPQCLYVEVSMEAFNPLFSFNQTWKAWNLWLLSQSHTANEKHVSGKSYTQCKFAIWKVSHAIAHNWTVHFIRNTFTDKV